MTANEPNFEFLRKQVDLFLPDEAKPPINKAIDICSKDVKVMPSECDTAYKLVNF